MRATVLEEADKAAQDFHHALQREPLNADGISTALGKLERAIDDLRTELAHQFWPELGETEGGGSS